MLRTANDYKYVDVSGHNITGRTMYNGGGGVLLWENVSWANEMAHELSMQFSGVPYPYDSKLKDYPYARDVQNVVDWVRSVNSRQFSSTDYFPSSFMAGSNQWRKIKDYPASQGDTMHSLLKKASQDAIKTRRAARLSYRKTYPSLKDVVSGDPVTYEPLRTILGPSVCPRYGCGMSDPGIMLSGGYLATASDGTTWRNGVTGITYVSDGVGGIAIDHHKSCPYYSESTYNDDGSLRYSFSWSSSLDGDLELSSGHPRNAGFVEDRYLYAEEIAVVMNLVFSGTSGQLTTSASTYYIESAYDPAGQSSSINADSWSALGSLTAPSVSKPSSGWYETTHAVFNLFNSGGAVSMTLKCDSAL